MAHVLIISPPTALMRVFYGIDQGVGVRGANRRDDVMLVQFFFSALSRLADHVTRESYFPKGQALIEVDGIYDRQTAAYIKHFEDVLSRASTGQRFKMWQDGVIDPKPAGRDAGPLHARVYAIIRLNVAYAS